MTCTAASHQGATKEPAALLLRTSETHPIFSVRAGAAICKLNVSGFRCHPFPAIFSCIKHLVLHLIFQTGVSYIILMYFTLTH